MSYVKVRKVDLLFAIENFIRQKEAAYESKIHEKMIKENAESIKRYRFWHSIFPWIKLKTFRTVEEYESHLESCGVTNDDKLILGLLCRNVEKLRNLCIGSHPHVNVSKEDMWIMSWG